MKVNNERKREKADGRRRAGIFSVKMRKKTVSVWKLCIQKWRYIDMKLAWVCSVVCVVLVCLLACGGDRESSPETLDGMTEDYALPVDLIVFLDASTSMGDSDPEGLGIEATRRFVGRIARDEALSSVTRIGVSSFKNTAEVMAQLGTPSIAGDSLSGIELSLSGNTNLLAALRSGHQIFASFGTFSGRKPVMLFITDGSPYDARKLEETGAYFLEIEAFIKEKLEPRGCAIYVVGIDAHDGWSEMEPRWQAIAHGVYGMKNMDQFETIMDSLIEQIYGIPPVAKELVKPGHDLEFSVPPYTERLEVYILKNEDGGYLAVHRPNDSVVLDDEKGVSTKDYGSYRSLSIQEPAHGKWRYHATQRESGVYRKIYPYRLKLVSLHDVHPLGKALKLEAAFMRSDGKPVRELPGYKFRFTGQITTPDNRTYELEFIAGGDGAYVTRTAVVPHVEGVYEVTLIAQGGHGFRSETKKNITVKLMPYAVITSPSSSPLKPGDLEVAVSILQAGEPLLDQDVSDGSILANLEGPSGEVLTTWLRLKPDINVAMLYGVFPEALRKDGEYLLYIQAADSTVGADSMVFHVKRTLRGRLSRWGGYVGKCLALLALLAIIILVIRLCRSPKVTGVTGAYPSSGEDVSLGQRHLFHGRCALMRVRRHSGASGRWVFITGASAGNEAVNIWYRSGMMLSKRRLHQDDAINLGRHTIRYV